MNKSELVAELLEKFEIYTSVHPDEIKNIKTDKAKRYALTNILSFSYAGRKFYISDDYSLNDNPALVRNLIQDINPMIGGGIVKNPEPQSDGAQYALGLDDTEYYLWEDTSVVS